MKRWRRWLKRGAIGAVVVPVALAIVGMTYQALATQADRRNFPPPGKLVDAGGHRLHIQCAGAGRQTVVLETGARASYVVQAVDKAGNISPSSQARVETAR